MMKNITFFIFINMLVVSCFDQSLIYGGYCFLQDKDTVIDKSACDLSQLPGVVWWGTQRKMTIHELAAYCAPVFWFSPDEPIMNDAQGKDIRIPEAFPFEEQPDAPVVYYQYNKILVREDADGPAYIIDTIDKNNSIVDLHNTAAIDLKFIAYFHAEEGLGGHAHDVEPTEFKVFVARTTAEWIKEYPHLKCEQLQYIIGVSRVIAEAHGLDWYFNTLDVDEYTKFPMHLLVEEGKHGMCTDKNSDGYYTPGYDVNRRVNDAWGVRDIMRTGALFTGGYQAWMAKVRRPEHRVFPPLPKDSHLRRKLTKNDGYASENSIYELRAFPSAINARNDMLLELKMAEKEQPNWPVIKTNTDMRKFTDWFQEGEVLKSLSISLRADGDLGLSFVFPFFIVKNLEDPMAGGFVVHRMYLKDHQFRDFGWMIMYAPSASRWIDGYFAAGAEWDVEDVPGEKNKSKTTTDFVLESGIKFRVNITKSPLKFLGFFTEFWGLRLGIKNTGFFDINRLTYVLELGAGVW